MVKRKCPCCNEKVINPLMFKKLEPYKCSNCNSLIQTNALLSSIVSIILAFYTGYLYSNDMLYGGLFIFTLLVIRWYFLDKVDALTLPLETVNIYDNH